MKKHAAKAASQSLRWDGVGHLDPRYAAELLKLGHTRAQSKDQPAFVRVPRAQDPLAEELGESFVERATSVHSGAEHTTITTNMIRLPAAK